MHSSPRTSTSYHQIHATRYHQNSLDQEIFLQNSFATTSTTTEWNRTYSLSSTTTTRTTTTTAAAAAANYQEFKMEIISQGKCLCGQYIRARLRRAGVLNRKAIQRLRTILEPSSDIVYEVFPALNTMGEELERMHPRLYINIARQLACTPYGELEDGDAAPAFMNLVAKDLFRSRITWGKIVSIFAVCGGFAIDCVRQSHYEYLQYLIDSVGEIIEDDLVHWLKDNNGWLGLRQHSRPKPSQFTFLGWLTLFVTFTSGIYAVSSLFQHIACHLYSLIF